MEEKNLIEQALEMHRSGKSIRVIAAMLGTSKSNVHRWINGQHAKEPVSRILLSDDVPEETGQYGTVVPPIKKNRKSLNINNMDNTNFEDEKIARDIILKKIEQEHALALRKEDREDSEIALRREQLRLEKLKLDQPRELRRQEEKALHWDMMQFFRNELELIEDSDNEIEISLDDLASKVKLLQQLLDRLEKHCFKFDLETEELAYHSNLKQLYRYFKNLYKENENPETEDEENDEDEYDEEEIDETLIEYNYDTKSIERIKMLTRAELDMEIEDL
ncbi:MAG: hypothetical protein KAZ36_06985 [Bacteroidales bacterium]|jgi:hypothetical protein|nr:hypothetical protein [Bacteroidales bacterium]